MTTATVRTQVGRCLQKLDLSCRHQLLALAHVAETEQGNTGDAEDTAKTLLHLLDEVRARRRVS